MLHLAPGAHRPVQPVRVTPSPPPVRPPIGQPASLHENHRRSVAEVGSLERFHACAYRSKTGKHDSAGLGTASVVMAFALLLIGDRLVPLLLSKTLPPGLQVGLPRRLGADPEQRHQLLEIGAAARGADGPAGSADQRLELVTAGAAAELVERHDQTLTVWREGARANVSDASATSASADAAKKAYR